MDQTKPEHTDQSDKQILSARIQHNSRMHVTKQQDGSPVYMLPPHSLSGHTLCMTGFPESWSESQCIGEMVQYGKISGINRRKFPDGCPQGMFLVDYVDRESAIAAQQELDQKRLNQTSKDQRVLWVVHADREIAVDAAARGVIPCIQNKGPGCRIMAAGMSDEQLYPRVAECMVGWLDADMKGSEGTLCHLWYADDWWKHTRLHNEKRAREALANA